MTLVAIIVFAAKVFFGAAVVALFMPIAAYALCDEESTFDQLTDWPRVSAGQPEGPQNVALKRLLRALKPDEVLRDAFDIGGPELRLQADTFLKELRRSANPMTFAISAENAVFFNAYQNQKTAHCNNVDALRGSSESGGRGAWARFSELERALGLQPPALSYITIAVLITFVAASVLSIFWADKRSREQYVKVNKRVACEVPATVMFLNSRAVGTITVLGLQGFRFQFLSAVDRDMFDGFAQDLQYQLEMRGQNLRCRMFFVEDESAGFIFASPLRKTDYKIILSRSKIPAKPITLSPSGSVRLKEALKKFR